MPHAQCGGFMKSPEREQSRLGSRFFIVPVPLPVPLPGFLSGELMSSRTITPPLAASPLSRTFCAPFSGTGTGTGMGTSKTPERRSLFESHRQRRWFHEAMRRGQSAVGRFRPLRREIGHYSNQRDISLENAIPLTTLA